MTSKAANRERSTPYGRTIHQAAKASHVESMTAYGWMLMNGKGAQANPDEAFGYLKRASKMGDKQADVFLAQLVKAKH